MKCIYLKQKMNKTIYCKKQNKQVILSDCSYCKFKEYKTYKPIKKRTYRQNKKEKERFSIIYSDLSKCCVCGCSYTINKHEVFYGKNRQNSIRYGFVIPLCNEHHIGKNGIHFNKNLDIFFKQLCQKKFEEHYGNRESFIKIFGRNYYNEE